MRNSTLTREQRIRLVVVMAAALKIRALVLRQPEPDPLDLHEMAPHDGADFSAQFEGEASCPALDNFLARARNT